MMEASVDVHEGTLVLTRILRPDVFGINLHHVAWLSGDDWILQWCVPGQFLLGPADQAFLLVQPVDDRGGDFLASSFPHQDLHLLWTIVGEPLFFNHHLFEPTFEFGVRVHSLWYVGMIAKIKATPLVVGLARYKIQFAHLLHCFTALVHQPVPLLTYLGWVRGRLSFVGHG